MMKEIIKPILALTVICMVVAGTTASMHYITHPVITLANYERARMTMAEIAPHANYFEPIKSDNLPPTVHSVFRMIDVPNAEDSLGYIFIVYSIGFGGNMRIICAIDADGKIIEVRTLQHSETRGLGDWIEHRSFTNQFDGGDLAQIAEIDSVTGATITFNAFINAVEDAFEAFAIITGGNQ